MTDDKEIVDRIRASASDRVALLAKLAEISYDPANLTDQLLLTRELGLRMRQARKRANDAHDEAAAARKEKDRQNSALHIIGSKLRRKSADARAEADQTASSSTEKEFQLQAELSSAEQLLENGEKELGAIQVTCAKYDSTLEQLEQTYSRIFVGDGPSAANDRALRKPLDDPKSAIDQASQGIQVEEEVMDRLRQANSRYKATAPALAATLASSQWQGWAMGDGASGTFADEDRKLTDLLSQVAQGDGWVKEANSLQPKVKTEPINIDTEGVPENHVFRKLTWDSAFLSKMEEHYHKMRASEQLLRADIDSSHNRKRVAEEAKIVAERDLMLARQKLVKEREALIHALL